MVFIMGLDLGQVNDYTAIAIIKRIHKKNQDKPDLQLGLLIFT